MNRFILAALLIALVTCGVSKSPARLSDTKTVLAEMEKDPFGATIIAAVALNTASGNHGEDVVVLIEEIIEQLNQEQQDADATNATNQANCEESISTFQNQIVETTNTIESTETAIENNELVLQQAKVDLAQADQDYEETIESIEVGTEQRRVEHERWVEEDYQNQISIATLEEGVKLINHMIHGVAFAQIKSRYDKVLEKLQDDQNKHSSLFKPLISSLTQLATKLNYENVMKILELLTNIRNSIAEERENARIAEEKAQADWERLLAHLLSEKQRLSDKRARLRSLIEATEELLEQLRTSLENNKVALENTQISLASMIQWCDEQSQTYAVESAEREREIEILERLLDHLREKAAQVAEYLSSRYA